MQAKFSSENLPLCPDCEQPMDYEDAGHRDIETMGGYSVQYFSCCGCGQFELIDGKNVYPCSS